MPDKPQNPLVSKNFRLYSISDQLCFIALLAIKISVKSHIGAPLKWIAGYIKQLPVMMVIFHLRY